MPRRGRTKMQSLIATSACMKHVKCVAGCFVDGSGLRTARVSDHRESGQSMRGVIIPQTFLRIHAIRAAPTG